MRRVTGQFRKLDMKKNPCDAASRLGLKDSHQPHHINRGDTVPQTGPHVTEYVCLPMRETFQGIYIYIYIKYLYGGCRAAGPEPL